MNLNGGDGEWMMMMVMVMVMIVVTGHKSCSRMAGQGAKLM
jgi:hypothetical protein